MNQLALNLEAARELGEQAAQACLAKAHRADPLFSQRAATAILNHLKAVRIASGEELTEIAIAHGARPPDSRAFGGVFKMLRHRGLIECVRADLPRKSGHGTSGGKLWSITA